MMYDWNPCRDPIGQRTAIFHLSIGIPAANRQEMALALHRIIRKALPAVRANIRYHLGGGALKRILRLLMGMADIMITDPVGRKDLQSFLQRSGSLLYWFRFPLHAVTLHQPDSFADRSGY